MRQKVQGDFGRLLIHEFSSYTHTIDEFGNITKVCTEQPHPKKKVVFKAEKVEKPVLISKEYKQWYKNLLKAFNPTFKGKKRGY